MSKLPAFQLIVRRYKLYPLDVFLFHWLPLVFDGNFTLYCFAQFTAELSFASSRDRIGIQIAPAGSLCNPSCFVSPGSSAEQLDKPLPRLKHRSGIQRTVLQSLSRFLLLAE
jgi:hypothetical protein